MHKGANFYMAGGAAVALAVFVSLGAIAIFRYSYVSVLLMLPAVMFDYIWSPNSSLAMVLFLAVFPVGFYLLWSFQIARGQFEVPERTFALLFFFIGLSVLYIFMSWDYGVKWQGFETTLVVSIISGLGSVLTTVIVIWAYFRPSATFSTLAHAFLFIWLSCLAFPWLGEIF